MIKGIEKKTFKKLVSIFFLLLIVEMFILKLSGGVSFIRLLEWSSAMILIILYYYIIRLEFKMASNIIEEKINIMESRFKETEEILKDELKMLKNDIKELNTAIRILHKDVKKIKPRKRK